jgi:Sulfotransferase domain
MAVEERPSMVPNNPIEPLSSTPLRFLYVGGWGRSGSTLLARLVSAIPGFVSVGEIRDIWMRGCRENRLCGCGKNFSECAFWQEVGDVAYGGWKALDVEEMIALRGALDRPWFVPFLKSRRGWPTFDARLRRYTESLSSLYRAIREVSGARVICDSSKFPSFGLLLKGLPDADVRVVHLVRDSRGVVYSWQKTVELPDRTDKKEHMARYSVMSAAARYVAYNIQAERLRAAGMPYLFMRYEDLVANPRENLLRVASFVEPTVTESDLSFMRGDGAHLDISHTVMGNPMRLSTGPLKLRQDSEWKEKMTVAQQQMVTLVTAPLLQRYGYTVRIRRSQ